MKKLFTATLWFCLFDVAAFGQNDSWLLTGNSSSNPAIHFIGTTDDKPLVFRVNNSEKFRLDSDGFIIQNALGNIKFSISDYYSGWFQMNTISPYSAVGSGFRISVNDSLKSQFFYNGNAFSHGFTLDGLKGNTDILSREGDVYLSTKTFLSNGLVVKYNTGFVGIGLKVPKEKLDVNGNIYTNGKVLIGTNGLSIGTHSLAVNGSAIFTKAVVKTTPAWPDYVFLPGYPLPSADSLERFIKLHGHLSEIPDAHEVEVNGIDLGEIQTLLLKKIEELTLIVIEQNNLITDLKKRVNKLESRDETKINIAPEQTRR